jgi:hypothetical protein
VWDSPNDQEYSVDDQTSKHDLGIARERGTVSLFLPFGHESLFAAASLHIQSHVGGFRADGSVDNKASDKLGSQDGVYNKCDYWVN